ncbi:MAG: DUF4386 domain-containing protein [Gemmatimonadales bacterium]
MTRSGNARVAGVTFLGYIAVGVLAMVLSSRASGGANAPTLAGVADHITEHRVIVVLSLVMATAAIVLGVTLHAITREEDPDLALLGLMFRVGEGVLGAFPIATLGLLWLGQVPGPIADPATAESLAALLGKIGGWQTTVCATLFAVGSTFFCWLLLRGRAIPVGLAWLGLGASVLLLAVLPLQLAGAVGGRLVALAWAPMALFEIPVAVWLIARGVAPGRLGVKMGQAPSA